MNKFKPINFDTVADIYDSYVHVDTDIPFYLKETENFKGEILELMCGTGRVSVPLLEAGRKLLCIDYSKRMLEIFRKKISGKNYDIELREQDVVNLNLSKKFRLVLLPFHSLSEILEKEKQVSALQKISEHLETGGIFICTLQNPVIRLKTADGILRTLGEFKIPGKGTLKVSFTNQLSTKGDIVTGYQYYELFDGSLSEKRVMEINFRPVTNSEFREMISNTELKIQEVYGDYSYSEFNEESSGFMIYKLTKD